MMDDRARRQGTNRIQYPAASIENPPSSFILHPSSLWPALVLLALVFAAYWPALDGQFIWDDFLLLKKNPLVSGELNLGTIWFRTDFPLSAVAFWLEWLVFGKNAVGFHVVNVALHALSAVLVWRLWVRLSIPGAWLAAALFAVQPVCVASVAWISELKNTLSLPFFLLSFYAYVKDFEVRGSRFEVQGSAFPSPQSAISHPHSNHPAPSFQHPVSSSSFIIHISYSCSLLFFLLALLAKTSTVMLPVVLLLWIWWRRGRVGRADAIRLSPFFLLALVFGVMSIWFQSHQAFTTAVVQTEGWAGRLAGAGWALWFYLGKALLPLKLNLIYPRWQIHPDSLLAWLPLLLLCGVFGLLWRFGRGGLNREIRESPEPRNAECGVRNAEKETPNLEARTSDRASAEGGTETSDFGLRTSFGSRPSAFGLRLWSRHVLFALSCFVATLFPALGFFDMYFLALSRVSDHFQYLSLIAVCALVAAAIDLLLNRRQRSKQRLENAHVTHVTHLTYVTFCVLLLPLFLLTFNRARIFASGERLWHDTLAKNPASWTAHNNLGCILAEQRQYDQARQEFEAALHLNARNAGAEANLGKALALQGRFPEAEPHFKAALAIKPDSADAHGQYAAALAGVGRTGEAIPHFREALRLEPDPEARLQFASLLYQTGNPREAITQLRKVVGAKPDYAPALNNLAWLLATCPDDSLRDGEEAVRLAEQACRITKYQQPEILTTLAAAYAEAGRFREAVTMCARAVRLMMYAGDQRTAAMAQQLLELYRSGHAYHEKRMKDEL